MNATALSSIRRIKDKVISIPKLNHIQSIEWDEIPTYTSESEAKSIILVSEHIISDIEFQIEQKRADLELFQLSSNDELALEKRTAEYLKWYKGVQSKLRSSAAISVIYKNALTIAGIKYE